MLDERDMQLLRALFREEGERIEERINARMDVRFQAQDERIDKMFQAQDERIDELFQAQDERIDKMFQAQDERIDKMFQAQDERTDKMFQAQDERIDKLLQEQEERINSRMDKLFQEQRRSIMHDVKVLMDAEFKPQFNLLSEELQLIREKMISEERMEEAEADIQVLKTSVRILSEDVRALKKAQ